MPISTAISKEGADLQKHETTVSTVTGNVTEYFVHQLRCSLEVIIKLLLSFSFLLHIPIISYLPSPHTLYM